VGKDLGEEEAEQTGSYRTLRNKNLGVKKRLFLLDKRGLYR
jgi:hypothetical protein